MQRARVLYTTRTYKEELGHVRVHVRTSALLFTGDLRALVTKVIRRVLTKAKENSLAPLETSYFWKWSIKPLFLVFNRASIMVLYRRVAVQELILFSQRPRPGHAGYYGEDAHLSWNHLWQGVRVHEAVQPPHCLYGRDRSARENISRRSMNCS